MSTFATEEAGSWSFGVDFARNVVVSVISQKMKSQNDGSHFSCSF